MGEKANDGGRSLRRLPASGAVAIGAVVGLLVAVPIALAVTGGDDATNVVAADTTTTTTVADDGAAAPPADDVPPDGPFDVVLTLGTYEVANGSRPFEEGQEFPGSTLECDATTCTLGVSFPTLVETLVLERSPDRRTASLDFRYETVQEEGGGCEGTGILTGAGHVELTADGQDYRGAVEYAADVFDVVPGEFRDCIGGRWRLEIVATPA